MKIKSVKIIAFLLLVIIPTNTFALKSISLDRELTEKEYQNLTKIGLDDETISNLDLKAINEYKDVETDEQVTVTKYFKEIEVMPFSLNRESNYVNVEISEQEYNSSESEIETFGTTHETNYKKLEIKLSKSVNDPLRIVTSSLTWKKLPSTKSYDVYAFFAISGIIKVPTATQTMSELVGDSNNNCTYTLNKNNVTNYSNTNSNWNNYVYGPSILGSGISMQLNTSTTPCIYDLGVLPGIIKGYKFTMLTSAYPENQFGTVTIRSSYHHAQNKVTLSESKNYSFSTSGYGGVIKFNNSNALSSYDKMAGVEATL